MQSAPRDPDALPKPIEALDLNTEQRREVLALLNELETKLAAANARRDEFRTAMVGAAAQCNADDSRLHIEANRLVEVGNEARPAVLDAINTFHGILTPQQRAALVTPILEGKIALGEDTEDGREQGLEEIAEALDLGFLQKVKLVKRAVSRLTISTSETSLLREQAIEAVIAFQRNEFDIRTLAIAKAPVIKLYTRFVLDLAQVVLPVLDEDQCDIAAGLLRRMFQRAERSRRQRVTVNAG